MPSPTHSGPLRAVVPVLIFARPPRPGACKTRLIPALGRRGAARLHRSLTLRTVQVAERAGCGPVWLCSAERGVDPFLAACAADTPLHFQCRGDLGRRMSQALDAALAAGFTAALLIGTDSVELQAQDVRLAAQQLLTAADDVLLPTPDGGYLLLGSRRRLGGLLRGIAWSSGRERVQTQRRLGAAGRRVHLLPPRADIDSPADLHRARRNPAWAELTPRF